MTGPAAERLAQIEPLLALADCLMSEAVDNSMKAPLQEAMRTLQDAKILLGKDDVGRKPDLLHIIDATVDLVTRQMASISEALDDLRRVN